MQVRVLGSLEVVRDETTVALPSAQQRRLLTALLLAPGEVVSTDRLTDALWATAPPRSALKSLRAHVSRLRTALGDADGEIIATHTAGYAAHIAAGQIDASRFEQLTADARGARSIEPGQAVRLLDEALGLWRGPAHADFADETFVRAAAVRLEELRLAAMEDRIDLLLAAGRHSEIIGELEALVRRHSLRERPHAQLMLALYRVGRQADALDVFRRLRATLADELGLEPSAALRSLERNILRQDAGLDNGPGGDAAPVDQVRARQPPLVDPATSDAGVRRNDAGADRSPLVEREAQLAMLDDVLRGVTETGHGRVAIIHGEAGIGKTAVVRRFCDQWSTEHRVLWGACDALFTPRPLGPIRDVADAVGGGVRAAVRAGAQPYDVAADLSEEFRVRSPSILVLEDLHWADEATLDVVRLLGRRAAVLPALLVITYRDDEIDRMHPLRRVLGELATLPTVVELPLAPLSVAAVTELAAPNDRDGTEVHAVTAGNPLFVVEVLAAHAEEVPASIRQAVLGRASVLGRHARALLDAIAIAPPRIDLWLLEEVTGVDLDHLDACVASGLIVARSSSIAFRHELARRAVVAAMPAHRGVTLHRRVLTALSSLPEAQWDLPQLAHHADGAGDVDAVLRFAAAAGREAAGVGAHREAAAHYGSVLRHADAIEPAARADVTERRAWSCYLTDQNADAIEAMEQAASLHRQLGDRCAEGDALRQLSHFLWCPGRTQEAMTCALRAVELLEQEPVGPQLGMACSNVAQLAMNAEDTDGTISWSLRALTIADTTSDVSIGVHARTNLATIAALAGDPAALTEFEECLATADAAGLDEHVIRALLNRAVCAIRRHEHLDATDALARAEAMCGELGYELMLFYVRAYQSVVALDLGDWRGATDLAELVLRYPRTSTVPRILALTVTALVAVRTGAGDPAPALDLADDLAEGTGELERLVPPALARAETAWLTGRPDEILDVTRAAWQLATSRGATWMIGPLAAWRLRAGAVVDLPDGVAEPYVLQATGRHTAAARWWSERGCDHAAALALLDAGDDDSVERASDLLTGIFGSPGPLQVHAGDRSRTAGRS